MCRVSPGWIDLKCDLLPVSLYAPNSSCHCLTRCVTSTLLQPCGYFILFSHFYSFSLFLLSSSLTFQLPTSSASPSCTSPFFPHPPHTFLFLLLFARLSLLFDFVKECAKPWKSISVPPPLPFPPYFCWSFMTPILNRLPSASASGIAF